MTWYTESIEPRIRDAVRLLRDNGFNTTCSCHHSMEIEGNLTLDGELDRLHHVLANNNYQNYTIGIELKVYDGWPLWTRFHLQFPKNGKQ